MRLKREIIKDPAKKSESEEIIVAEEGRKAKTIREIAQALAESERKKTTTIVLPMEVDEVISLLKTHNGFSSMKEVVITGVLYLFKAYLKEYPDEVKAWLRKRLGNLIDELEKAESL